MRRHPQPQPSRFSRWLRRLWPDRNPLRRTSDRMEAAIVAWLAAALLAGVPLAALSAGRLSYDAGVSAEHAQQAWRQVPAVLLMDSPDAAPDGPARATGAGAYWTAPNGVPRAGRIPAPPDARAGTVLRVWVDASGRLVGSPVPRRQVELQAALAGFLAAAGLVLILLGTAALARRVLDRRRLAAWAAEWQATAPRWTVQR
jgi:hypothetical protein